VVDSPRVGAGTGLGLRQAITEGRSAAPSPGLVYALGVGSALVTVAMALTLARTIAN